MNRGVEMFSLAGRRALVTGGNRGLGLAFARALAECGAAVTIVSRDRDRDRNAAAVERLAGEGRPCTRSAPTTSTTPASSAPSPRRSRCRAVSTCS